MISLTRDQVAGAIAESALNPVSQEQAERLAAYGNLLIKWNAHTNLTGISDAGGILQRHIVESVAAAQALPPGLKTLLDYGTGAGLPGIPIAICRPEIRVVLAESQAKKVAFLREAARILPLDSEIFSGRVEELPPNRRFEAVTMRAVDKMDLALADGALRVHDGGWLLLFVTGETESRLLARVASLGSNTLAMERHRLPTVGELLMIQLVDVPRGTIAD